MKKVNKMTMVITSIIILLPMFIGLILWKQLPEQIATHFGANGQPDGWSSKAFAVFGLPFIMLAIHWVCILFTSADPKYANLGKRAFGIVVWLLPVISVVMNTITYAMALGVEINISLIVLLFLGVLFTVIGNYLPKSRQNYTMGFKLPWTLADEDNWNHTHRLAGFVWIMGGILLIFSALFRWVWAVLPVGLVLTLVPTLYSYIYYKKNGMKEKSEEE